MGEHYAWIIAEKADVKIAKNEAVMANIAERLAAEPKKPPKYHVSNDHFGDRKRFAMTWRLNLPFGVPYEAILHPHAFANVVASSYSRLQPGHRIEIMPEDISYIAELLVLEVNGPRVRLRELPPASAH